MDERGRRATKPQEIPVRGWRDIAFRVRNEVADDRVGFVAAAVAFYLLIAVVPLLASLVGAYGLIADAQDVPRHVETLSNLFPAEVLGLVEEELRRIASEQDVAGLSLVVGLALSLWAGSKATDAVIVAMNIAYDERESRKLIWKKLVSLGLTFGALIFLCVAAALLAATPAVVELMNLPKFLEGALTFLRWLLLLVATMFWFAVIYRYAPCRSRPKWRWVSWGAFIGTLLWVLASAAFSFYVSNWDSYSATYGSLGAIITIMMWCFISGFCVMVGAEINAETEHQTTIDSTEGPPQEMGKRGAHVADTIGKTRQGTARE